MANTGSSGAKSPKYEWRWIIKIRAGVTMVIPAETRTAAIVMLEVLLPEYGRAAKLQQRVAGRWIPAYTQPGAAYGAHGPGAKTTNTSKKKTAAKSGPRPGAKAKAKKKYPISFRY
jgi:hypothetical protein